MKWVSPKEKFPELVEQVVKWDLQSSGYLNERGFKPNIRMGKLVSKVKFEPLVVTEDNELWRYRIEEKGVYYEYLAALIKD